jgi:hypothetical protein
MVLNSSEEANSYQLILLAAEGVALCLVCVVWVWILLKNVAARRFMLYSVLMVSLPYLLGSCMPGLCYLRALGLSPGDIFTYASQHAQHALSLTLVHDSTRQPPPAPQTQVAKMQPIASLDSTRAMMGLWGHLARLKGFPARVICQRRQLSLQLLEHFHR